MSYTPAMLKWLRSLSGQSLVLPVVLLVSTLFLASCGASPLNLLSGGGPNVAANTQVGKNNTQTVGTTEVKEQKLVRPVARGDIQQSSSTNKVQADSVETVVVNELPVWAVALGLFGFIMWSYLLWKLPTPDRIWSKNG